MAVLKIGGRYASAVSETQIIIVRTLPGEHVLACGGAPMLAPGEQGPGEQGPGELDPAQAEETQMGKRYVNAEETFEVLCVKPGQGALSLDGQPLGAKQAKALPSSD